jgi:hypothetical protein
MMRLGSIIRIVLVSFSLILWSGSMETVRSDDWKFINQSESGTIMYYNVKLLKHGTKDIVQVRTKTVPDEKMKKGLGGDRVSHAVSQVEVNCKDRKIRTIHLTIYSTDGSELDSWDVVQSWEVTEPDTVNDLLLKEVCSTK